MVVTIWWGINVLGGIALIYYVSRGPNAVWGTATVGLIIGLGIAICQPGFEWLTLAKGAATGALVGLVFELLPRLVGKGSR